MTKVRRNAVTLHSNSKMKQLRFKFLAFAVFLSQAVPAQTTFDSEEGCLNVVDFSFGHGVGEYGDRCFSANYLHERFINEQFSIGGGIGYSHHKDYKFSAIPVFLSSHYFFFDKRFPLSSFPLPSLSSTSFPPIPDTLFANKISHFTIYLCR